jgi:hypothetical protein
VSYLQLGDEGHEVEGDGDRLPEAGQVSGAAPVRDPLAPVGVPLLQSYKKNICNVSLSTWTSLHILCDLYRSRIHERTITLRFLDIILRVL